MGPLSYHSRSGFQGSPSSYSSLCKKNPSRADTRRFHLCWSQESSFPLDTRGAAPSLPPPPQWLFPTPVEGSMWQKSCYTWRSKNMCRELLSKRKKHIQHLHDRWLIIFIRESLQMLIKLEHSLLTSFGWVTQMPSLDLSETGRGPRALRACHRTSWL